MRFSIFTLFVFVLFTTNLSGQNNDLNVWTMAGEFKSTLVWFIHYGDKIVVDGRYNYDADKTAGFCLGKKIGKDSLAFVPEVCGYYGRTKGYGPELIMYSETNHLLVFSQTQFVKGAGNKSFTYDWTDVLFVVNKHLTVGAGGQAFKEISGDPTTVDIGPQTKLSFGKIFFRVWPKWATDPANRGQKSLWMGVGYAW